MHSFDSQTPEQELLCAFEQSGNKELLGIVLERYTLILMGVCMKYLKDSNSAQDILQQVFIKAILTIEKQRIDNLGGWLYRVAKNECLDYLRKYKNHTDVDDLAYRLEQEELNLEDHLKKESDVQALKKAMESLKEEQRVCIELFYLKQKSYQEIVEMTKFDIKQVKSNIQNGKRNLKIKLESQ